jgi:glycosyltransferase involved in cell wall biosynthesis
MNTAVIIPAINEEESIGHVLAAIPSGVISEIIVVDGGSHDRTVEIANAMGARVIHQPEPGYGLACATGVRNTDCELLVFMDADGADDPAQISKLLTPILDGRADMVLGSRLAGGISSGAMLWHQKLGNHISASLIRWLYGLQVTDLSPFRSIRRHALLDMEMQEMTYGWPTEMIVKSARYNIPVVEIPVPYRPRFGGKSKISGTLRGSLLATYYILTTIIRYRYPKQSLR